MTVVCPACDCEYETTVHLKNGSWAFEPLEHLLAGVEITEADGMFCASWGAQHLDLYVHTESQVERGRVR